MPGFSLGEPDVVILLRPLVSALQLIAADGLNVSVDNVLQFYKQFVQARRELFDRDTTTLLPDGMDYSKFDSTISGAVKAIHVVVWAHKVPNDAEICKQRDEAIQTTPHILKRLFEALPICAMLVLSVAGEAPVVDKKESIRMTV